MDPVSVLFPGHFVSVISLPLNLPRSIVHICDWVIFSPSNKLIVILLALAPPAKATPITLVTLLFARGYFLVKIIAVTEDKGA